MLIESLYVLLFLGFVGSVACFSLYKYWVQTVGGLILYDSLICVEENQNIRTCEKLGEQKLNSLAPWKTLSQMSLQYTNQHLQGGVKIDLPKPNGAPETLRIFRAIRLSDIRK